MQQSKDSKSVYTLKNFLPLILIFLVIIGFVLLKQRFITGISLHTAMSDFMGAFFVIFGLFKIMHIQKFAEAYAMYDLLAKQSHLYALTYPFIELVLGIAYLTNFYPALINSITLVLMLFSALGVAQALAKHETIQCACLGTVFKLPMTYVTLFEDLLMAGMALVMLVS